MGRRKIIFYGRELEDKFFFALGFPDYKEVRDCLSIGGYENPKIDWSIIDCKINECIPTDIKSEIDFLFETEFFVCAQRTLGEKLNVKSLNVEVSEAEFQKKATKIEHLARNLMEEIDELAEVGSLLLMRPKSIDGLTSAEEPDNLYSQLCGKTMNPTEDCFFDYYSFRKLLDYFAEFSSQNGGFHSRLSARYDRMPAFSWYESFVRRVILAFWPTNFPMTVTVPTETNESFRSPIILVLEELREQFNQFAASCPGYAEMYEEWTYRQHVRLVLRLRKEFED